MRSEIRRQWELVKPEPQAMVFSHRYLEFETVSLNRFSIPRHAGALVVSGAGCESCVPEPHGISNMTVESEFHRPVAGSSPFLGFDLPPSQAHH